MKKRNIVLAAILVLGVAGAAAYALMMPRSTPSPASSTPTPAALQSSVSPAALAPGQYIDYRAGVIEATQGTKILFFHAPWCPQCRKLEQSIKAGVIPDGVAIIKVDYDSNQALRQKYGVTIQTSLVRVNNAGDLVKRYVAYDTPSLSAIKDNLLP